ncbi:MAG: hypothetical protein K6F40_06585 [Bacteroidales bacterium]|nr:hypothetical protein [Bacteroidales bacterium]
MDTIIKKLALLLFVCLCLTAQGQENIVDRLNKTLGVRLPAEYEVKVKNFVDTNNVMKDEDAVSFTEQYIVKEMGTDWNIDKQNQLLFIWHYIYKQVTDKDLYIGNDGNTQLESDFNNRGVNIRIRVGGERYKNEIIAYMKQLSAEARQQSAEYDRRIAEAIKEIMRLDSVWVGNNMKEFYNIYKENPSIVKQNEIDFMKKTTQERIAQCKKYNIDYRAILLKEVGDKKKVEAMLKFYGVE